MALPFITSLCSAEPLIGDAVRELAKLGFRNIELTGGTRYYPQWREELNELKAYYGLQYLVHNYFPPSQKDFVLNIASQDSEVLRNSQNLIRSAFKMASDFGTSHYGIHPGFVNELSTELVDGFFRSTGKTNLIEAMFRFLERMHPWLESRGFYLAVENLAPRNCQDRFSFIMDDESIKTYVAFIADKPHLGLLIDLGHLNIASNLYDFSIETLLECVLSTCPDKVFELHLSGNDGILDQHNPLPLDCWQVQFLHQYEKLLKDVPITFEWNHCAQTETFEHYQLLCRHLGRGNAIQ